MQSPVTLAVVVIDRGRARTLTPSYLYGRKPGSSRPRWRCRSCPTSTSVMYLRVCAP